MKIGPIEENVALTSKNKSYGLSRGRPRVYPLHEMNVNSSFLVSLETEEEYNKVVASVSTLMAEHRRKYGKVFTMRRVRRGRGKYKFRVWRVK